MPAKLHLLERENRVNQLIKNKRTDLALQRNAAWISGSFCFLASYLWHTFWTVLSSGRKKEIPASGNAQVVDILLIDIFQRSVSILFNWMNAACSRM